MLYKSKYPIAWTVAQLIINKLEYWEVKNDAVGLKVFTPWVGVHVKMNVDLLAMK